MKRSLILLVVLSLFAAGAVVGCGGDDEDGGIVKTMDEYRQEAAEDISADNAEDTLEEIERELEQELP